MWNLTELQKAMDQLQEEGYHGSISMYSSGTYHVSISKRNTGKLDMTVSGSGDSITKAISDAMMNFPHHPLDGTQWVNNRLEAPKASPKPPIDRAADDIQF